MRPLETSGRTWDRHRHRAAPLPILSRGSVLVAGENVHYEASGTAEESHVIIYLHGAAGSSATWGAQLTGLAGLARCYAPDLPGHARSEGQGFSATLDYGRWVLQFLDALAVRRPVILAGVSLGAAIALDTARVAPSRVAGLVLAGVDAGNRVDTALRRAVARGDAPDGFVRDLFSPSAPETLVADRLKLWRLTNPWVRFCDLEALAEFGFRPALRAVPQPVLLIAGEADAHGGAAVAADLAEGLENVVVTALPAAGCLGMVEQPSLFNRAVAGFLAAVPVPCGAMPPLQPGGYRRF